MRHDYSQRLKTNTNTQAKKHYRKKQKRTNIEK